MLVFGIDPGVTRTGVVLMKDDRSPPIAFATFHSAHKLRHKPAYHRANGLGYLISDWIMDRIAEYGTGEEDEDVRISIEHPIYNRNPDNYFLQSRVFQSILAWLGSDFPNFSVLEVNPKTVKLVATGNGGASKEEMVASSHFKLLGSDMHQMDREALADAEGIARCSFVMPPVGDLYRINEKDVIAETVLSGVIDRTGTHQDS